MACKQGLLQTGTSCKESNRNLFTCNASPAVHKISDSVSYICVSYSKRESDVWHCKSDFINNIVF